MDDVIALMCFNCLRPPDQIPGWDVEAEIEGLTVEEYARQDGTYNPSNQHFCCDDCYAKLGYPTGSGRGWKAP